MSIFGKIMTAIRGGAREAGEAIVDANAIRIFEQEIKDAENHMQKAKQDLTGIMAQQMKAGRELEQIKSSISEHEDYASQALAKGDEALALEVAEKIATLDSSLAEQQQSHDNFAQHATRLKQLVNQNERLIKDHQRQLEMVKTTESVQKATAAVTNSFSQSSTKVGNAKASLERIKARQQGFDDRLNASEMLDAESGDGDLKAKLSAAGIGGAPSNSAQSVLDRLKAKSS